MKSESKVENGISEALWTSALKSEGLKQALSGLPQKTQRLIYLRFWESMTIEEIADEMRVTWDEADHALTEALTNLRESMLGKKSKCTSETGAA